MSKHNKKAEQVTAKEEAVVEPALDAMLEEQLEASVEPVKPESAAAKKVEVEPLAVIEGQLGIYENRVVNVPDEARVAVVENLGFGELYVDNTGVHYTANYRLEPDQKKEYKGTKVLFLASASRPNFRVTFYK